MALRSAVRSPRTHASGAPTRSWSIGLCLAAGLLGGCRAPAPQGPQALRLVDLYRPDAPAGATALAAPPPRLEWRFTTAPPAAAASGAHTATRGWQAGPGIA